MTEETLPKYDTIIEVDFHKLGARINQLNQLGYKVHTCYAERHGDLLKHYALMSLSTSRSYEGATNFVAVEFERNAEDGTPLIERLLGEGWVPASDVFSKHIVLMKVKK